MQAFTQDDSNAGMHWGIACGVAASMPGAFWCISQAQANMHQDDASMALIPVGAPTPPGVAGSSAVLVSSSQV